MPTIYAILAQGGLALDLGDPNSSLLISDLGNRLATISKRLHPERIYEKVFIGYCGRNQRLMARNYPDDEIREYVWEETWKFIVDKDVYILNGKCSYTRPIKGRKF